MKKLILLFLFLVNLSANGIVGIDIGLGSVDVNSRDSSDNLYVNYDYMTAEKGFALGLGLDTLFYQVPIIEYNQKKYAYVMSPQIKIGYAWERLFFKGAIGYGVHRINDKNYWGPSYDVSVDVNIYNGISIGAKYKRFKSSYKDGSDYGTAIIGYMSLRF